MGPENGKQISALRRTKDLADFVKVHFGKRTVKLYRGLTSAPEIIEILGIHEEYERITGNTVVPEIARRAVLEYLRGAITDPKERDELRILHQSKGGKTKRKTGIDWTECNVYGVSLDEYATHLASLKEFETKHKNGVCAPDYEAISKKINLKEFKQKGKIDPELLRRSIARFRIRFRKQIDNTLDEMVDSVNNGQYYRFFMLNRQFENTLSFAYHSLESEKRGEYDNCRQSLFLGVKWENSALVSDGISKYSLIRLESQQ
jgi:hypothetical protein